MNKWPLVPIAQCATIVSGATPSTSEASNWGGDICWATPKDLSDLAGAYISDTPRKITTQGLSLCSAEVLPPDSVLFSSRAPIGHVAINTVPMATNQGFKSFVPDRQRLDPRFLYYWLRKNRRYLEGLGNGATFKEVSKAVVARIVVPLPSLDEQRRIADILDKADALRVKRRAALAQLDTLTHSIFLDIFGDPIANPRGWALKPLSQLLAAPLRNGLSPSKGGTVTAKVLTLSAVTGHSFESTAVKTSTFRCIPPEDQSVNGDDLLICRGNGNPKLVGKGYFPTHSMRDVTFPDTMVAARIDATLTDRRFVEHVWNSPLVRRQIDAAARTTNGTLKVNQAALEAIRVLAPPLTLQVEFGARAAEIQRLNSAERQGLHATDALFASLQHRAFRGEL